MIIACKQSSYLIRTLRQNGKAIEQVYQVHAQAITRGLFSLHSTAFLLTQILHTFTSLLPTSPPSNPIHPIHYVAKLFNLIPNPSTFCYNTIIRAHTLLSSPQTAFIFFSRMAQLSIPPDSHTFPFAIKACAQINSLLLAKALHCQALRFGFLDDVFCM